MSAGSERFLIKGISRVRISLSSSANYSGYVRMKMSGSEKSKPDVPSSREGECLVTEEVPDDWLEWVVVAGFTVWQIMFMALGCLLVCVMFMCCCVRFRIPRTKQEIEADYVRKQITRKFQKQLRRIQNADMDEMDLKSALDRIRAEFKSDTESLAQSEALSAGASLTSSACNSPRGTRHHSYRRASDIGVSIEELIERRNSGLGAKITTLVGRLRPRRPSQPPVLPEGIIAGVPQA